MNQRRVMALAAAIALIAVACGTAGSDNPAGTSTPDGAPQVADSRSAVELVSPTETDRPLDLSGGVTSSTNDVTVIEGDPRADLSGGVRQATEPWPTDWARRTVDPAEFLLGIATVDPRDRIPPIDTPKFESIEAAEWLDPREPGALVQFNGEVRFYPLSILTRHEIVNDRFGDIPVAITFCPLCNTALTFDTRVDGQALRFGVSGLLRGSDLVMWDDSTTTLWQQITGEAVVGELAGAQLEIIPTSIVAYGDAREAFPDSLSLARNTGFGINYGANPYVGYSSSARPFLFDGEPDPRFPALSRVVGVSLDGFDKAYPFELIAQERAVNDQIGQIPITVFWGGDTADALDTASIADGQAVGSGLAYDRRVGDQILTFTNIGDNGFRDAETSSTWNLLGQATDGPLQGQQLTTIPHRNEFWFAWASFFPDGDVYIQR